MKKSTLMHGKMAVAKKLREVEAIRKEVAVALPNALNRNRSLQANAQQFLDNCTSLRKQVINLEQQLQGACEDVKLLEYSIDADAINLARVQHKIGVQYTISNGLRREVQVAKKQALFNLVLGTMGWVILAVTVAIYVWR